MKNGLIYENGELFYYKNDVPDHAGVIKIDGDIYYIGRGGKAVKGIHVVHSEMANDILKRGTYTFGDDYKLVKGSYIAPKKNKNKRKKSSRKQPHNLKSIQKALLIGWIAITVFLIGSQTLFIILNRQEGSESEAVSEASVADAEIVLPVFDREVALASSSAMKLYNGEISITEAIKDGDPYRAFRFEYDFGDKSGILLLSESPNLVNPKEYILPAKSEWIDIDNLKTGTDYYYKVTIGNEEHAGQFTTAKGNRFINIPGAQNTRDIGGYTTLDGKTVKQGLLIRGTELDGLVEPSYYIDNETVNYVRNEFGFVCDLDLRNSNIFTGNYRSRLGEGVTHKFYASPMYGSIFNENNIHIIKDIFADLANPENYPMYMHCTYGADRTGTIVFLLQGVLNVSEEDMKNEYRLTAFSNKDYATTNNIDVICTALESYEGDTLQEKIVDFLVTDVGVSREELESIRKIFLE